MAHSTRKKRKIDATTEQDEKQNLTFSKRKVGLFNKLTELSILCQAEAAVIVRSPDGKELYACGYPTTDAVVRRFLSGRSPQGGARDEKKRQEESLETLRIRYEATQGILNAEKNRLMEAKEAAAAEVSAAALLPSWWQRSIEGLDFEAVEEFKGSLEDLRMNLVANLVARREEERMLVNSMPAMPNPPPQSSDFPPLIADGYSGGGYQAWNRDRSTASSSDHNSLVPNFGFDFDLPAMPNLPPQSSDFPPLIADGCSEGVFQAWNNERSIVSSSNDNSLVPNFYFDFDWPAAMPNPLPQSSVFLH